MILDSNVIRLDSHEETWSRAVHAKAPELLAACEQSATKHLTALVKRLLDSVDDALFALADKAENNTIQSMYFDAMREVRLVRERMENNFYRGVIGAFLQFRRRTPAKSELAAAISELSDGFSLIEDEALEESLAISSMVEKARNSYMQPLYALEQRLGHLAGDIEVNDDNNPIGPGHICQAFQNAVRVVDADIKIHLIIYKLFDKYVMAHLEPLYEEVNAKFAAAGILPNIKMQIRKKPRASAPQSQDQGGAVPPAPDALYLDTEANGEPELFETLHQLLALHRQAHSPAAGGGFAPVAGSHGPTSGGMATGAVIAHASPQELLGALSELQHVEVPAEATGGGTGSLGAYVKTSVLGTMVKAHGDGQAKAISHVDEDIIDVVCMLFEFILDDHNLPAAMKALIGRLQIPMLKVAILDKEFFSTKSHPARRLLNELARAGMGLDDDSTPDTNKLHAKIEYVVNRILGEFADEVGIFQELLDDFIAYREAAAAEQEEEVRESTKEAYQEREEFELAKRWVAEVVAARTGDSNLPATVEAIIKGPWSNVLLHTYVDEGLESPLWNERLRFLDLLLWSVEPMTTQDDRQKLVRVIPSIVDTLRTGLDYIAYPEETKDLVFGGLQVCHITSLRGGRAGSAMDGACSIHTDAAVPGTEDSTLEHQLAALDGFGTASVDLPVTEDGVLDEDLVESIVLASAEISVEIETEPQLDDDEFVDLARELALGTWVEFLNNDGTSVRGKLIWKSEVLSEYTFVNWKYRVVAEKTLPGLAAELRRGTAAIIEDVPLMDRALDAAIKMLGAGKSI